MRRERDRFLRDVARELEDLGPLERRRALAEVRSDLVDFAMDGHSTPPSRERLEDAARAMPSPREVAQAYLARAKPPLAAVRLSLVLNATLCVVAVLFASSVFWSPRASGEVVMATTWLGAIGLIVCGLFGLAVYVGASLAPRHAVRWRHAILPAVTLVLILDATLGAWVSVLLLWPSLLGLALSMIVFVGGAYSVAYTHGQMPRFVPETHTSTGRGDYFRVLERMLQDLDRTRRRAIVAELRAHVAGSGVRLDGLPPDARFSAVAKVLGPPEDVSAGYLAGKPGLTSVARLAFKLSFASAVFGTAVGTLVLGIGLSNLRPCGILTCAGSHMTPLGLLGSVGLLSVSFATLAGVARVARTPFQWPDAGPPTATLALAGALLMASVLGSGFGGLTEETQVNTFAIKAVISDGAGGHFALWTQAPIIEGNWGVDSTPTGAWITHLDANLRVLGTEEVPTDLPSGPVLGFERRGGEWMALFPNALSTWGGAGEQTALWSANWQSVDGRLNGSTATVVWTDRKFELGLVELDYLRHPDGVLWTRSFTVPGGSASVALGTSRILLVTSQTNRNNTTEETMAGFSLLDETGGFQANRTFAQTSVALSDPQDHGNFSSVAIGGPAALDGAFWIAGTSSTQALGTHRLVSWVSRVNETDGASTTYELHNLSVPARSSPPVPGDHDWIATHRFIVGANRVYVASAIVELVFDPSSTGDWSAVPGAGGLYLTTLEADGVLAYTIRLDEAIVPWDSTNVIPALPLLGEWGGEPIVVVAGYASLLSSEPTSTFPVAIYTVSSSLQAEKVNVEIPREAAWAFTRTLLLSSGLVSEGPAGIGAAPGVLLLPGEALLRDDGILGWRDGQPAGYFAPVIVRIDAPQARSDFVYLATPQPPPDSVSGLLGVGVASTLVIVTLYIAYPRWRERRARQEERLPAS